MSKFKSKKFRVALEGATTDGRKISREWLTQMAKNYDPKKYGARINLEHLKSVYLDSDFRCYGDVLSLSTEEFDDAGTKKLALVAEISPTDDLVALNKRRQKVYTSIEVNPSFADTGEAYLMGIAITDSPASLGVEMLEFSAKAATNPLQHRKSSHECLFTASQETEFSFEEVNEEPGLFDKIKGLFTEQKDSAVHQEMKTATELFATELQNLSQKLAAHIAKTDASLEGYSKEQEKMLCEITSMGDLLSKNEETTFRRKPATGGDVSAKTDC